MRNIKLTISYDGTQYHGWQIQKNGITIQEVIQNKLSTITNEQVKLIGASRTDARVHSIGQVANFHTDSHIDPSSLKKALNSLLPRDIVILSVEVVEKEFNARYSAHRKTYRYIIHNSETMLPFLRNYVWYVPYHLSHAAMHEASQLLVGEKDFSAFLASNSQIKNMIRHIYRTQVDRNENTIIFEIEANGFLKYMVRNIVGTLVEIGKNKISVNQFAFIIESKDRKMAGMTAPPHGLYLLSVVY